MLASYLDSHVDNYTFVRTKITSTHMDQGEYKCI
jgi:hypothetical protein